jgi:hypothetical protein
MNWRRLVIFPVVLSAMNVVTGCGTSKTYAEGTTSFGMSTCYGEFVAFCNQISNKTHKSHAPAQFEYLAPDGNAYLWIGRQMVHGKWWIRPFDPKYLCFRYERGGNCQDPKDVLSSRLDLAPGDPLRLQGREKAPWWLGGFDRRSIEEIRQEMNRRNV